MQNAGTVLVSICLMNDHHLEYCGLKIRVIKSAGGDVFEIDQSDDVATFLLDFGLDSEPFKTTPMPNLDVLLSDSTVLGPNSSAWCKSAIGVLHFWLGVLDGIFHLVPLDGIFQLQTQGCNSVFSSGCDELGIKMFGKDQT